MTRLVFHGATPPTPAPAAGGAGVDEGEEVGRDHNRQHNNAWTQQKWEERVCPLPLLECMWMYAGLIPTSHHTSTSHVLYGCDVGAGDTDRMGVWRCCCVESIVMIVVPRGKRQFEI